MGVRNHGHYHGNRSLQYHVFLHCSAGTGKRASMVSVTRGPCGILISSLSFKHNHTHILTDAQNVWMYGCPLLQHGRRYAIFVFLKGNYIHTALKMNLTYDLNIKLPHQSRPRVMCKGLEPSPISSYLIK